MLGIKRKIQLGFTTIGILLFLSGLISSLELWRLNKATHSLIGYSNGNIELTKQMLDAVQEQNTALLLHMADSTDSRRLDSMMTNGRRLFDQTFLAAQAMMRDRDSIDLKAVHAAAEDFWVKLSQANRDSEISWIVQTYHPSYVKLTTTIKEYMVRVQQRIVGYTELLENNAYRASMVGIIALASGILLILVFYFMINTYFISPILRITNALRVHVNTRLPFEVPIATKDELLTLKEYIVALTAGKKSK